MRSVSDSIVLVIGSSGAGKSTLAKYLRKQGVKLFDTDDCRTPGLDKLLMGFRQSNDWTAHNNLWYSMVMGGIGFALWQVHDLSKRLVVIDHNGNALERYQPDSVHSVLLLDGDVRSKMERVSKRQAAKGDSGAKLAHKVNLAKASHGVARAAFKRWQQRLPNACERVLVPNDDLTWVEPIAAQIERRLTIGDRAA